MIISRRDIIKMGMAAGAALSFPPTPRVHAASTAAGTVRMAMHSHLLAYDPYYSYSTITWDHALAIYDTLFGLDSQMKPQPQMVGEWRVSGDKRSYTFELRDGLAWHDGTPVTAADCVATLRRWGQMKAGVGPLVTERVKDISSKGAKTFIIELKEPLSLLIDILAAERIFVMREKDAIRSPTEQVTANIGSGPFKFNHDLAKPGASVTYDRNENYVPRAEAPDMYAGGKVVNVERVIWDNISDQQTAFAALQAGEIDFMEHAPPDFFSMIDSDPNLALQPMDNGDDFLLRLNCLQKPFDNVKARQAILHLVDQEAFAYVAMPNSNYTKTVTSLFGNSSTYSNDENTGWYKKGGDPEAAKRLLQEAGYSGEKVVILQATSIRAFSDVAQLLATVLRKIGVNAELAPSDWSGVVARTENKGSVDSGGWSITITSSSDFSFRDPMAMSWLAPIGEAGFSGWVKSDEFEAVRARWMDVGSLVERKALARQMQKIWWDIAGTIFLCGVVSPIVRRKTLTDLVSTPGLRALWSMKKA
jgi:peptide/nickel transport system substrate-binding protein